jgi:hypothetical protein
MKIISLAKIVMLTAVLGLLNSCSKQRQDYKIEESKINQNSVSTLLSKNTNSIQSTSSTSSSYNSIQEIIRAYAKRPNIEPSLAGNPDSVNLVNMNTEVANYLHKYPCVGYIDPTHLRDPDFVFVTLIYSCLEENGALSNGSITPNKMPLWLDCVASVIGGIFDIRALIANLGNFSAETVWAATKWAIKRYTGWFLAATLIYHIATDCL